MVDTSRHNEVMSLRPTPATNESAGPFRKVTGTADRSITYPPVFGSDLPPYTKTWRVEILECGHDGNHLASSRMVTRRRCSLCR